MSHILVFSPSFLSIHQLATTMDFHEIWYWVLLTNFTTICHHISVLVSIRSKCNYPGHCSGPKCHNDPAIDSCCMMPQHRASDLLVDGHTVQEESFYWTVWPLKMGLVGWLEMSVNEYQHLLCNSPEEEGSRSWLVWKAIHSTPLQRGEDHRYEIIMTLHDWQI